MQLDVSCFVILVIVTWTWSNNYNPLLVGLRQRARRQVRIIRPQLAQVRSRQQMRQEGRVKLDIGQPNGMSLSS